MVTPYHGERTAKTDSKTDPKTDSVNSPVLAFAYPLSFPSLCLAVQPRELQTA
jgi:hypothetical protein